MRLDHHFRRMNLDIVIMFFHKRLLCVSDVYLFGHWDRDALWLNLFKLRLSRFSWLIIYKKRAKKQNVHSCEISCLRLNNISHLRATGCHLLLMLYSITHHSVACFSIQVNTPCLIPILKPSRAVLDLPTPEGWKAELSWLFIIFLYNKECSLSC